MVVKRRYSPASTLWISCILAVAGAALLGEQATSQQQPSKLLFLTHAGLYKHTSLGPAENVAIALNGLAVPSGTFVICHDTMNSHRRTEPDRAGSPPPWLRHRGVLQIAVVDEYCSGNRPDEDLRHGVDRTVDARFHAGRLDVVHGVADQKCDALSRSFSQIGSTEACSPAPPRA